MESNRSLESVIIGTGIKYGGKAVSHYAPDLKIALSLLLVRLGYKKTVSLKMKHMMAASAWADRLGIGKTRRYTFSFPGGIRMHRAVGIPEFDNSNALTIMSFEQR